MAAVAQTPEYLPPPEAVDLLRAGGALPHVTVTVEQGPSADVRVPQGGYALATRDFIMANLAVGSAIHVGGNLCSADAGPCPSCSA